MKKVMAYLLALLLAAAAHVWVTGDVESALPQPGEQSGHGDMSQVERNRMGAQSTLCNAPEDESEGVELPGAEAEQATGRSGRLIEADCVREATELPTRLSI